MNIELTISAEELRQKLNIKDGYTPIKGKDYFDGEDATADEQRIVQEVLTKLPPPPLLEPKEVRDKLETLKVDERIDVSAIRGIDKLKEEFSKAISSIPRGVAPRATNSMKLQPLTPNGVTKIFTVPKSVTSFVLMSDAPFILFKNGGFTINGATTKITLTVDNAPSLGGQLLYVYSSYFNT